MSESPGVDGMVEMQNRRTVIELEMWVDWYGIYHRKVIFNIGEVLLSLYRCICSFSSHSFSFVCRRIIDQKELQKTRFLSPFPRVRRAPAREL